MRLAGSAHRRSTVEIRAHVAVECGLNHSHSGCIKLLARLGFECRKPKPLPRAASAEKQAAFIALYDRLMRELPADEAV
ncbi:MAG: winged helix-turn-helix domain-containing protein [Roseovarius sp.]|nr:winged helix-turn-helix domain-containing protein [Roseovarius sp.]